MLFRVNAVDPQPICGGNSSHTQPSLEDHPYIQACNHTGQDNCFVAGDPSRGTNMYVATAPSMAGPWKTKRLEIGGLGGQHISNPSIVYVKPESAAASIGNVWMAFRYNGPHGESVGFATAPTAGGPYTVLTTLTCRGCEDPFIWQQPDGTMHCLFHLQERGFHVFSQNGTHWVEPVVNMTTSTMPADEEAFCVNVTMAQAPPVSLNRRERPGIVFNSDGLPATFYSGAAWHDGNGNYRAFSLGQSFHDA